MIRGYKEEQERKKRSKPKKLIIIGILISFFVYFLALGTIDLFIESNPFNSGLAVIALSVWILVIILSVMYFFSWLFDL